MPSHHIFDKYYRLEPNPHERDLQAGFEAATRDPLWFLARQWQMGEFQGENASTPVSIAYTVRHAPIRPADDAETDPRCDPAVTPAEAIVESELEDWWTPGRRIRIGAQVAASAHLAERVNWPDGYTVEDFRLHQPPAPYDRFDNLFDGRTLWRRRALLGLTEADFGTETPPHNCGDAWQSDELVYQASFNSDDGALSLPRHRGGRLDWYSAERDPQTPPPAAATATSESHVVAPAPLQYPGAPHSRWWEIEDSAVDIGGYPPDTAHFATMLLVDLIYSHSDDWFLFPVEGKAAQVVTITQMEVTDSFGRHYDSEANANDEFVYPGLRPPEGWSLFRTLGITPESLVLWLTAVSPLEGAPLERVQFGVDEYSNLLWAVERRVDARDVISDDTPAPPGAVPLAPPAAALHETTVQHQYTYVPSDGVVPYWHPYKIDEIDQRRRFVQRGYADLSYNPPIPMPYPRAEVLLAGTPDARQLHQIEPATIPLNGIEIERRWELARDVRGNPILWIQRQRKPLLTPPARRVRFDVMQPT